MFEKTLESPLDSKEIKLVNPKGNQSWIFIERIDAEAEAPVLWPPDVKIWLTGKDPDAGKEWKQKEKKGTTEDKTLVWYHRLSGQEFEQIPGDGEGQEGLACCSPWGPKELDTTERLNNKAGFASGEREGGRLSPANAPPLKQLIPPSQGPPGAHLTLLLMDSKSNRIGRSFLPFASHLPFGAPSSPDQRAQMWCGCGGGPMQWFPPGPAH